MPEVQFYPARPACKAAGKRHASRGTPDTYLVTFDVVWMGDETYLSCVAQRWDFGTELPFWGCVRHGTRPPSENAGDDACECLKAVMEERRAAHLDPPDVGDDWQDDD